MPQELVEGVSRVQMDEFTHLEEHCKMEKYRMFLREALLRVTYQLYGGYCDLLPKGSAENLLRR